MTNQDTFADKVREILANKDMEAAEMIAEIKSVLPTPPRPTLADMTAEEIAKCQQMQADMKGEDSRVVITNPYWVNGRARVMTRDTRMRVVRWTSITPRPDLPRMLWPGDQEVEDANTVKVGDLIRYPDDPRLDALPDGSTLLDLDDDPVTKLEGEWAGRGYIPIESDGEEYGPWKVVYIPKETDR